MNDIITQDGEVIETEVPSNMAVALQKAEIDQAVSTARTYPRSLKRVQASILSMATLDRESAEECMYALPRGGKPIKGPSIRFAEVLKQSFGNCRSAARVVHVDRTEGYVEAEGVFHDLETNAASTARVRRRITDKRGKVFSDDMIIVTGNAACSIAMRNAILAGVPKPLWRNAFEQVQAAIVGDVTTLSESRTKAVSAFARYGVTPDQLLEAIGRQSIDDVDVDDLVTMRGMVSAIKNGEATVEEMFGGIAKPKSDHETLKDPLADQVTLPDQTVYETPDPAPASSQGGAVSDGPGESSSRPGPSRTDQDEGDTPPTEDAAPPSRMLLEAVQKMFEMTQWPDSTDQERMGLVEKVKDQFKPRISDHEIHKFSLVFKSCQEVIRGNVGYETSTGFYSEMLGHDVSAAGERVIA